MPAAPAPEPPTHASRAPRLLRGLLIGALTFAAYVPVTWCGFIWDDDAYVTENPTLVEPGGLRRIWFEPRSIPQYYPLVHTTFWIEHRLWGFYPPGYHLTNVALHAFAALLLWIALRRLRVPGAWLAAAVFAVHPVHAESVAWVTERKNVLSLVLYLAAFLAYVRTGWAGVDANAEAGSDVAARVPRRVATWYALALLLFLLALLSKSVTASLPAAILVVIWWKRGTVRRADVLRLLPLFAIGVASGLTTAWLERVHVGAAGADWDLSPADRVVLAGRAVWFYAGKLLLPHPLVFIYPRWNVDASDAAQWTFPSAALLVIAGLWLLRGRLGRAPLAAALLFVGTLVPALGFFDVYPFLYSFVADHFQYHASVGLISLFVAGLVVAWRRWAARAPRIGGAAAAGVLLLALAALTWRQVDGVYRDERTLWQSVLARNPSAWIAHNNLASVLDDPYAALPHYRECLRLRPDWVSHLNLAAGLARTGDLGGAATSLAAADAAAPQGDAQAAEVVGRLTFGLANALAGAGRLDNATAHYERALALRPGHVETMNNLAWTLAVSAADGASGAAKAVDLAERAAAATGQADPALLDTLAAAYADAARFDDAVRVAEHAAELARASGHDALAREILAHRDAFRANRPLRESRVAFTTTELTGAAQRR